MRRREEAEGDKRMIGSRRRAGFFWREETSGVEVGGRGAVGRDLKKAWAVLRWMEKS
jgi:hypothetical protein